VNPGELLEHQQGIEVVQTLAAMALIDIDAEETHRPQLAQALPRQRLVAPFDLLRQRPQLTTCKIARNLLELSLVRGQLEMHRTSSLLEQGIHALTLTGMCGAMQASKFIDEEPLDVSGPSGGSP
jgi:hypothetical protein